MSQVTGGKVTYIRRVKTGDYEHKEFGCELTFNVGEGEDHKAIFDTAANAAWAKTEVVIRANGSIEGTPAADPPPRRTPKARTAPAAEPDPVTDASPKETPILPGSGPSEVDPAAVVEEDLTVGTETAVTDATLLDEVQKKNAAIKNPTAIKKLIGQYAKALAGIPQDKRRAFLTELAGL